MRRTAWILLLLFAFAIPWEYSLDLGEPLGNVARIAGVCWFARRVPAILSGWPHAHALRILLDHSCALSLVLLHMLLDHRSPWRPGKIRGYFQELMIVWLVWEFADARRSPQPVARHRRRLVGSRLAHAAAVRSPEAIAAGQIRFAAYGQDPNEVARFLDLGFPLGSASRQLRTPKAAAPYGVRLLARLAWSLFAHRFPGRLPGRGRWNCRLRRSFHSGHAPAGCRRFRSAAILSRRPLVHRALGDLARLATIPEQLQTGDLNQRINIWSAGWRAFTHAPLFGTGAGSFVAAAHLSPIDTAHNTALSIAVWRGLCALFLAAILLALGRALRVSSPWSSAHRAGHIA
jgi:hypothetical protein